MDAMEKYGHAFLGEMYYSLSEFRRSAPVLQAYNYSTQQPCDKYRGSVMRACGKRDRLQTQRKSQLSVSHWPSQSRNITRPGVSDSIHVKVGVVETLISTKSITQASRTDWHAAIGHSGRSSHRPPQRVIPRRRNIAFGGDVVPELESKKLSKILAMIRLYFHLSLEYLHCDLIDYMNGWYVSKRILSLIQQSMYAYALCSSINVRYNSDIQIDCMDQSIRCTGVELHGHQTASHQH